MLTQGLYAVIKPYALLALLAFVLGFVGTLAVTLPARRHSEGVAVISAPAAQDWNLPKQI